MSVFRSVPSPRSSNSVHSLLPPITANERNRQFLLDLNQYIDAELSKVKDRFDPEQRYTVYKSAFNQIIDFVTAYKPLLTAIKAEYEECIETIQRGQKQAFFLSGKLKAMASEPSTIRNYRKRSDELEQRVGVIKEDNARLEAELAALRAAREERARRAKEVAEPPFREIKRDPRNIPGLTVQQSTNLALLTQELAKLERQLKELNISYRTRFQKKEMQMELKEGLAKKVSYRDNLTEQTEHQKLRRAKLKTAVEAAQAYLKIQPPHQTIGDAVIMALTRQSTSLNQEKGEEGNVRGTPSTTFEEDDPTREKEAEMMLEYIEKFNELIEDAKYEEAAVHAASSPKGILRTPETLNRFKELQDKVTSEGRSPLLAFCDSLMATVPSYGVQPSELLSMESVKVALDENRLDLLSHWIAQDRLSVSVGLGDLLCEYAEERPHTARRCLALAQKIYIDAEAHMPAMSCMVRQGRVTQALEYGQKARCGQNDYIQLLQRMFASPGLARGLLDTCTAAGRSVLPLGVVARTLMQSGVPDRAVACLLDVQMHDKVSLQAAVSEDTVTSPEDWQVLVQLCQDSRQSALAIDLLAAVTVANIVQVATSRAANMRQDDQGRGLPPPPSYQNATESYRTSGEQPTKSGVAFAEASDGSRVAGKAGGVAFAIDDDVDDVSDLKPRNSSSYMVNFNDAGDDEDMASEGAEESWWGNESAGGGALSTGRSAETTTQEPISSRSIETKQEI